MIVNKSFLSASKPARLYYMGTKVSSRPKWPFWTKHFNTEKTQVYFQSPSWSSWIAYISRGTMSRRSWQALPIIQTQSREDKLRSPSFCTFHFFSLLWRVFAFVLRSPSFCTFNLFFLLQRVLAFVLRRILCSGFRKCFGLVVGRSTDKGRQALSLKYNRRTLLRWSLTTGGDKMPGFGRSWFDSSTYLHFIFSTTIASHKGQSQNQSLPCFLGCVFQINSGSKSLDKIVFFLVKVWFQTMGVLFEPFPLEAKLCRHDFARSVAVRKSNGPPGYEVRRSRHFSILWRITWDWGWAPEYEAGPRLLSLLNKSLELPPYTSLRQQ